MDDFWIGELSGAYRGYRYPPPGAGWGVIVATIAGLVFLTLVCDAWWPITAVFGTFLLIMGALICPHSKN